MKHLGLFALVLVVTPSLHAGDWPQFRGPYFNGSTDEKNLPSSWSLTENIAWTAELPVVGGRREVLLRQTGGSPFVTAAEVGEAKVGALTEFQARQQVLREVLLKRVDALSFRFVGAGHMQGANDGGSVSIREKVEFAAEFFGEDFLSRETDQAVRQDCGSAGNTTRRWDKRLPPGVATTSKGSRPRGFTAAGRCE